MLTLLRCAQPSSTRAEARDETCIGACGASQRRRAYPDTRHPADTASLRTGWGPPAPVEGGGSASQQRGARTVGYALGAVAVAAGRQEGASGCMRRWRAHTGRIGDAEPATHKSCCCWHMTAPPSIRMSVCARARRGRQARFVMNGASVEDAQFVMSPLRACVWAYIRRLYVWTWRILAILLLAEQLHLRGRPRVRFAAVGMCVRIISCRS
ncbi:hypothetical protein BC628DRAFT_516816 [Trametes gibbosa]|nr:hypothetical protein BC628DRAFT_516816 [Trametes gibbosa]